ALKEDTEAENAKAENNRFHTFPRLHRILPLLTFGQLFEGYHVDTQPGPEASYNINTWYTPGTSWELLDTDLQTYNTGPMIVERSPQPINPSVIGVTWDGEKEG